MDARAGQDRGGLVVEAEPTEALIGQADRPGGCNLAGPALSIGDVPALIEQLGVLHHAGDDPADDRDRGGHRGSGSTRSRTCAGTGTATTDQPGKVRSRHSSQTRYVAETGEGSRGGAGRCHGERPLPPRQQAGDVAHVLAAAGRPVAAEQAHQSVHAESAALAAPAIYSLLDLRLDRHHQLLLQKLTGDVAEPLLRCVLQVFPKTLEVA